MAKLSKNTSLDAGYEQETINWFKYYSLEEQNEICELRQDFSLGCAGCFMFNKGKCEKGKEKHKYYKTK